MNRRKRTEILIDGSPNFARELASEIERNYDIHILQNHNMH